MAEPRIVCVGANLESRAVLEAFAARGIRVQALVTSAGHGGAGSDYVDLRPLCAQHGIAVIETEDINSAATVAAIRELAPDYIFTLGWSQLFKRDLLSAPTQYVVGSHPTPLPLGRGRAPIPWTILEQRTESAVTLFRMGVGVDSGAILVQKHFAVPPRAYAWDLYQIAARALADAYVQLVDDITNGTVTEREQAGPASWFARRGPQHGHIDFRRSADEIERLVRAVSYPYPGAYSYFAGRRIAIWKADVDAVPPYKGQPGQVLRRDGEKLLVQAGDRPLWLSGFSDDTGPLAADAFKTGEQFGYAIEDELHRLGTLIDQLTRGTNR